MPIADSEQRLVTRNERRIDEVCFYRVDSAEVNTRYIMKPRDGDLFKAPVSFTIETFSRRSIEEHLDWSQRKPSAFVSVFDKFYAALRRAQFFYERGDEHILIVKIDARNLVSRSAFVEQRDEEVRTPVWESLISDEYWLSMAEVGPILGIPRQHIDRSEWLACGSIPSVRHIATMPIIGNRIWLNRSDAQPLAKLLVKFGQGEFEPPWNGVYEVDRGSSRYVWDWSREAYVKASQPKGRKVDLNSN